MNKMLMLQSIFTHFPVTSVLFGTMSSHFT